ncbi:hypothetical protein BDN67DRAFT_992598 [Paxillus ammoniavirescens]|nr:hypothetical protein BDN67DRAFT_992598 [Paxillus ammoniavirescens]
MATSYLRTPAKQRRDLRVLQFVKTLLVQQTPNVTAWCKAVEVFLAGRGYTFAGKDNLRRRFNNAYHWYCMLVINNNDHEERELPLNYLHTHCPLCFVDCIVCVDAWFTQKHSKNPRGAEGDDPPNPITSIEDVVEEGMCVPVSVLDGCGQSFIAADERQEKVSTQSFADTGLMALLCRHDRVLWLVNLTSAREKQHYALALLKQFIAHIPNDMRLSSSEAGCGPWTASLWM